VIADVVADAIVTVVLNGRRIDASRPATIVRGVTMVPIDPFVRDLAERIDCIAGGAEIRIARGARELVVRLAREKSVSPGDDRAYSIAPCVPFDDARIPLASLARALGGSVAYDARAHTLFVSIVPEAIAPFSPMPYQPPEPGTVPTFAPTSVPMPRPTVTGIPRPRRTPVLIESQPRT